MSRSSASEQFGFAPQGGFQDALHEAQQRAAVSNADLREAAEHLVSSAFLTPMLGSVRETSFAKGPFAPGVIEKRFGPLLDQHLADRVTQASRLSLVDAIVARYGRNGGAA